MQVSGEILHGVDWCICVVVSRDMCSVGDVMCLGCVVHDGGRLVCVESMCE